MLHSMFAHQSFLHDAKNSADSSLSISPVALISHSTWFQKVKSAAAYTVVMMIIAGLIIGIMYGESGVEEV